MFQDISIEDLLKFKNKRKITVVDVRSPSEFKEATIPGSINIPFFNDDERKEVGTLYKQVSPEKAKERGLEIASAKLPFLVQAFQKLDGIKAVFCWRGGMRSKTTATVLDLMGMEVYRLDGGYRSFRNLVVDTLNTIDFTPKAIVLNGNTGNGKTRILHRLLEEGYPVLDLEGMANHRGSIFGQIGLQPNNQKKFDGLLFDKIQKFKNAPYILFEGESKRIGKVVIPEFLLDKKEYGTQIIIEMPMEERVKHILEDYQPERHHDECTEAFNILKKRIHTPIAKQIEEALSNKNYALTVQLLLEYYYDPLYNHTAEQIPDKQKVRISANTIDEAVDQLKEYLLLYKAG